jgi:hypothetical protein
MTIVINASKARQNFFNLLYAARDKRQITKVMIDGEVVARISPDFSKGLDWDKYMVDLEKAVRRLSKLDWSDVLTLRKKTRVRRYRGW